MKRNFDSEKHSDSRILQSISKNLSRLIKDRGWTYVEAAREADISPRYITELIQAKANITMLLLEHIAENLGIAPYDLLRDYPSDDAARAVFRYSKRQSSSSSDPNSLPAEVSLGQELLVSSMLGVFERLGHAVTEMSVLTGKIDKLASESAKISSEAALTNQHIKVVIDHLKPKG